MLNSLVRKFATEGRPTGIQNGLRHAGFGESCGVHVANRDIVKLLNDARREFVVKIVATVRNLCVNGTHATFLPGALGNGKRLLRASVDMLRLDLFASGQRGKVFQAKVDADATARTASVGRSNGNVDHDVQEPVAARVFGEVRSVLDFPLRERATVEYAKGIASEPEGAAFALQFAALERNPPEVLLAPIAQVRALLLRARLGVLLAHGVHRAGVKTKFFAAALRELVQVEPGMPAAVKSQRILLPVVAEIPDEVARPGLLVQQSVQRLHPVSIDEDHFWVFKNSAIARRISSETGTSSLLDNARSSASIGSGKNVFVRFICTRYQYFNRKATTASQSAPFTPRPEGRGFSEQI